MGVINEDDYGARYNDKFIVKSPLQEVVSLPNRRTTQVANTREDNERNRKKF